jgi:2-hydroxy-3-oxopropionate reductase
MHKDLSFVLASAAAVGSSVPMATAAVGLYGELKDQGLGDLDLAVVRQTIANLSASAAVEAAVEGAPEPAAAARMTATVQERTP